MSHAAWSDVWNRALALLSAEPVPIRILAGLAAAFAAVMILEGMRVSFLPAGWLKPRPHDIPALLAPKKRVSLAKVEGTPTNAFEAKGATGRPFRPHSAGRACTPKRSKVRISRHRAERPKIRRMPASAVGASFSPAPPADSASWEPAITNQRASFSEVPPAQETVEL